MLHLSQDKLEAYNAIEMTHNAQVAEAFIKAMDLISPDDATTKVLDTVAVSMLISKAALGVYIDSQYPDCNSHEVPVDLRNLCYYLQQCSASLSAQYIDKRQEQHGGLIL